jgi:DNA-directed RNA polymerase subunit M/transcription elongation factor TFIIS
MEMLRMLQRWFTRTAPKQRSEEVVRSAIQAVCHKCGSVSNRLRYARDNEYGERLLAECGVCGFKWSMPTLDRSKSRIPHTK